MMPTGERLRKNAYGRYYVTDECDGCGACASLARINVEASPDGSYYYVIQQPLDAIEEAALKAAMGACPRHCLKDDGDRN